MGVVVGRDSGELQVGHPGAQVPPHAVNREAVAEAVHNGDPEVGRVIRRHRAAGGSFFLYEGAGLRPEPRPGLRAQGVVPVTEHQAEPGFLGVSAPQQPP